MGLSQKRQAVGSDQLERQQPGRWPSTLTPHPRGRAEQVLACPGRKPPWAPVLGNPVSLGQFQELFVLSILSHSLREELSQENASQVAWGSKHLLSKSHQGPGWALGGGLQAVFWVSFHMSVKVFQVKPQ